MHAGKLHPPLYQWIWRTIRFPGGGGRKLGFRAIFFSYRIGRWFLSFFRIWGWIFFLNTHNFSICAFGGWIFFSHPLCGWFIFLPNLGGDFFLNSLKIKWCIPKSLKILLHMHWPLEGSLQDSTKFNKPLYTIHQWNNTHTTQAQAISMDWPLQ